MITITPNAEQLTFIAGPCVVESRAMLTDIAGHLAECAKTLNVALILKASYKKANRTSVSSFTGIGNDEALTILRDAGSDFGLPTITDIHETTDAELAARYVDALQIPAFLFRQTDLLIAAGNTGKAVNIKKGQFAAPDDMIKAADKVRSVGNTNVWVCERGTTFGYHDLVVDMRGLVQMRESGCPVIYDATHSVQKPSAGAVSGGSPQFIPALARAAVAVGVDGVFFETHPNPTEAKSDSATQMPLHQAKSFMEMLMDIHHVQRSHSKS
ncbi:MAG: 3-deoxy-8-phosphooctulonate synthase [Candidatus Kapabacteria bacterium]|nr:3-deoxy-8-phosphooctulonate synthase [Candidatus Kapabacteria bacterium]